MNKGPATDTLPSSLGSSPDILSESGTDPRGVFFKNQEKHQEFLSKINNYNLEISQDIGNMLDNKVISSLAVTGCSEVLKKRITKTIGKGANDDTKEIYLDNVENRDWAGLFWALACFASPIIGLLGSIIAFSTGRKDMGIGFLTALALLPIFLVGMLIVAW